MVTAEPLQVSEAVNAKSQMHWRSTGWTPLAYPVSALVLNCANNEHGIFIDDTAETNPYFPLNRHVLLATVRELLILDGTLDKKTLKLSSETVAFRDSTIRNQSQTAIEGPRCLSHLDPERYCRILDAVNVVGDVDESHTIDVGRKRKKGDKAPRKKQKVDTNAASASSSPLSVANGEALAEMITRRSLSSQLGPVENLSLHAESNKAPPRKVSDADSLDSGIDLIDEAVHENDISLFFDLSDQKEDGFFTFRRKEIPAMLNVSIVSEDTLRYRAINIVTKLTASFHDESLRLFLGYKASSLKRERLLRLLATYLFDVSHAMFAWKQTESEVLAERIVVRGALDKAICESLFDDRALKKIGGFDDYSLLPQALSVERGAAKNESWEGFAKTSLGRRLLRHHREGKAFEVGQKRRGQRVKYRSSSDASEESGGQRSRSSSIASMEETVASPEAKTSTLPTIGEAEVAPHSEISFADVSEVLQLTLKREAGKTWGVLLSREGTMCLVDRAPENAGTTGKKPEAILRRGDMILSVRNERGETASPPNFAEKVSKVGEWFRSMVLLFKTSNELHLTVRRV